MNDGNTPTPQLLRMAQSYSLGSANDRRSDWERIEECRQKGLPPEAAARVLAWEDVKPRLRAGRTLTALGWVAAVILALVALAGLVWGTVIVNRHAHEDQALKDRMDRLEQPAQTPLTKAEVAQIRKELKTRNQTAIMAYGRSEEALRTARDAQVRAKNAEAFAMGKTLPDLVRRYGR